MNVYVKSMSALAIFGGLICLGVPGAFAITQAAVVHYVVTNDDNTVFQQCDLLLD